MTHNQERPGNSERGIALISTLMAMTMLLALGIAVVYSTTVDNVVTKSQRVGEQSFFAADAGVGRGQNGALQFGPVDGPATAAVPDTRAVVAGIAAPLPPAAGHAVPTAGTAQQARK